MDDAFLKQLQEWVKGGRRQVDITLGGYVSPAFVSIYVRDFDLDAGQNITKIEDIDLVGRKMKQIEALKNKVLKMEREVAEYGNTSQESS